MQEQRDAVPMDINFHPENQNIMTDIGFSNMLYQVLNLKPGGGLWAAPVCSTWVYMLLSQDIGPRTLCFGRLQKLNL